MRQLRCLLGIILLYVGLCQLALAKTPTLNSPDYYQYQWGRGLTLPAAHLNFGGYFEALYEQPEAQQGVVELEDLSVFITWTPHARLRFFTEIEPHNWINSVDGTRPFGQTLNIERLFVDVLINENLNLVFGKFLTPFGRWNLIHSAPLVWTSQRPVVNNKLRFAHSANGLLLNYTSVVNEHNLDIAVYFDNSSNLEPKSFDNILFHKAAGFRVNYEVDPSLQMGISYLAYQNLADLELPTHHLLGADFLWQAKGYELLFESLYHVREGDNRLEEKGLFLQGVAPLGGKLFAVGRYEYFDTNAFVNFNPDKASHIGVAGLSWRPYTPLVFKSEYRFGDNNQIVAPNGLFLSVAMFF